MIEIELENVRCFHKTGSLRISPLTVLVGENSAGKSSFMACQRIAFELAIGVLNPNFNKDPFFMGAFKQISHYRGGQHGQSEKFKIALHISGDKLGVEKYPTKKASFIGEFEEVNDTPSLSLYQFLTDNFSLELKFSKGKCIDASITVNDKNYPAKGNISSYWKDAYPMHLEFIFYTIMSGRWADFDKKKHGDSAPSIQPEIFKLWRKCVEAISFRPYAFAPVRTEPKRTYDYIDFDPQVSASGGHIPIILANLYNSDKNKWMEMKEKLDKFGTKSNLFEEINIKRLGKNGSDPFQIMVKTFKSRASNLIDVGYGVSQSLPILVDLIREGKDTLFLLQQPEVHLHPRGQAELGSFLYNFVKDVKSYITVETHSDYLLDRIRMDVRDDKQDMSDRISILYFERQKVDVQVHQIKLDNLGNVLNPPQCYRQFFLEEERRFFEV